MSEKPASGTAFLHELEGEMDLVGDHLNSKL